MVTTTLLTSFRIRYGWEDESLDMLGFDLVFRFPIDSDVFFSANALKIARSAALLVPLALGCVAFVIMITWKWWQENFMAGGLQVWSRPLFRWKKFLSSLFVDPPKSTHGTAVFLRSEIDGVPHAMLHNLAHNKVIHEQIIFLTVHNADIPAIADEKRVQVVSLGNQCFQVNVHYGFKETCDIPSVCIALLQGIDSGNAVDFILHFPTRPSFRFSCKGMSMGGAPVFATMSRNARQRGGLLSYPPPTE